MESTDSKLQAVKPEWIPMAHKIETPDNISFQLTDAVQGLQIHTQRTDLIADLASLGMTIEQLMVHFQVSPGSVKSIKDAKAFTNGRFVKRAYIDVPGMGRKLVRDKLPFEGKISRDNKDEYIILLKKKLAEETKELIQANGQGNRQEELADVSEVTDTILEILGINSMEVKQYASSLKTKQKRAARRESKSV